MSNSNVDSTAKYYGNRHIPPFLALSRERESGGDVQVVHDGHQLNSEALRSGALDISQPILVLDTPASIGMTVFCPTSVRNGVEDRVTVRHIADVIGHQYPIRVLDVEHQEELQGWTLGDLVESFEDESRISTSGTYTSTSDSDSQGEEHKADDQDNGHRKSATQFSRRKAAAKASNFLESCQNQPRILNQISLEFSKTNLVNMVKSPQFVRDLDWIELQDKPSDTPVSYYCLTSQGGSYTDFHVDFGGTSVWYHVLSGAKMFCLIAPTEENLRVYEEWLNHKDQASIFLPDKIQNPKDVITVSLNASQTFFIPTGWIHAVFTPEDSIVLGGNFLHGFDIPIQLEINDIEQRSKTAERFRFPHYREIHFSVAAFYLQKLRSGSHNSGIAKRELANIPHLLKALEQWHDEIMATESASSPTCNISGAKTAAEHAAAITGCESIEDFLRTLQLVYKKAISSWESNGSFSNSPERANSSHTPKKLAIRLTNTKTKGSPQHSPRDAMLLSDSFLPNKAEKTAPEENASFRIVISTAARELHQPLPSEIKKTNPRKEEANFVDAGMDDDDWVPSARQKALERRKSTKRLSLSGSSPSPAKKTSRSPVQTTANSGQIRTPPAKKPKTSARQRLLKKFR